MPCRLYYHFFATDGFISLPTDPTGTKPRRVVYIWGFVGGLYQFQPINGRGRPTGPAKVVNPALDIRMPRNLDALRGTAVTPSPRIDMDMGDELYITLVNLGMLQAKPPSSEVHTIHIHGAHAATQVDGVPETSWGVPQTPPGKPGIGIIYYFKPERPGTYFYHCHQEASTHIQMGMYGVLVVYPSLRTLAESGITKEQSTGRWFLDGVLQPEIPSSATNRNFAYEDIHSYYDRQWVLLFSDIDTAWHEAVHQGNSFKAADYKPDAWLINGRAFPDTLLPTKLPKVLIPDYGYSIPRGYESFVRVTTSDPRTGKPPDRFLLRMANVSYQPVPFHTHGWHGTIVGKDAMPRPSDPADPAAQMVFTVLIGSGESYDVIFTATDKRDIYEEYIFCGKGGLPSLMQQVAEATAKAKEYGTFIPPPASDTLWNNIILQNSLQHGNFVPPYDWKVWNYGSPAAAGVMFPQYYIAHNHDDYKITNNGAYPGGQLIVIETDYPSGGQGPYASGRCASPSWLR